MKPELFTMGSQFLAGISFYGDPIASHAAWTEENEIGLLWKRLHRYLKAHKKYVSDNFDMELGYEIHLWDDNTPETGHYEIFTGYKTVNIEETPVNLQIKSLPRQLYAKFHIKGSELNEDIYGKMYSEWLPAAGLTGLGTYMINRYDGCTNETSQLEDSSFEALIPVKPVEN